MSLGEPGCVTAPQHTKGLVLFHAPTGRLFRLSETGARIWAGLSQQLTLDEIANDISRAYRVEPATAREDAAQFVAEIERERLIEPQGRR